MDWFKISPLGPPNSLKRSFSENIVQKIENGTALSKFNFGKVLKQVPKNEITKRISESKNYNEQLEAMIKLEMLHITKKKFEELVERCTINAQTVKDEIHELEQKYIEPTYVYYGPVSYPKRSYTVGGEDYTTYKGAPKYNTTFFAAVATLVISGIFFG